MRTISIVSRVVCTGELNRTPCHPSMTCGPLTPRPRRNLPPESSSIDMADMASMAGVRAPSWAIPVPRWSRLVRAARKASGVKASYPHASGTHAESHAEAFGLGGEVHGLGGDVADRYRDPQRSCRHAADPKLWSRQVVAEETMRYEDGPTVEVEVLVDAAPAEVWKVVCDITVPPRFSDELMEVAWLDGATEPELGARFVGRNQHPAIGRWETVSVIAEYDPPQRMAMERGG